jgi:fructosamine-3-kinase
MCGVARFAGPVTPSLPEAIAECLATEPVDVRAIAGGDINQAFRVELAGGGRVFVKHRADAPAGMFATEGWGLEWLRVPGGPRIPAVVAVRDEPPRLLALEWIDRGAAAQDHDETLGRALAALHRSGAPAFGLDHDNYIATIPQPNGAAATWADFYWTRRLEPLTRRLADAGRLDRGTVAGLDRLAGRLPDLCGPPEPPARLHGDLWGGNAIVDAAGAPVLIDPAVYGGHREVDLAMMRLFGGFSERVFAAYEEAFPLADGHRERVGLWQLWPLLVHVALFGGSYAASVERTLARYVG